MTPEPSKWQYRVTWVTDHPGQMDPNELLDHFSSRGWELVSGSSSSWIAGEMTPQGAVVDPVLRTKFTFFFRRPREGTS
jgi:hypothetical protein